MEQKFTNLQATVSKLHNNIYVFIAKQEEMVSIYKSGGVPTENTTGGGGGMTIAPGPDLAAYIG